MAEVESEVYYCTLSFFGASIRVVRSSVASRYPHAEHWRYRTTRPRAGRRVRYTSNRRNPTQSGHTNPRGFSVFSSLTFGLPSFPARLAQRVAFR